ncbi:MAG: DUF5906 domain-containing protein [Methylocystis sp.]
MTNLHPGNNEPSKRGPKANTKGKAKNAPKASAKAANGHDKTEEAPKKEAPRVHFEDLDIDEVAKVLGAKANAEGFIWFNHPNKDATGYNGCGLKADIDHPYGFSVYIKDCSGPDEREAVEKFIIETFNLAEKTEKLTKKEKEEYRLRMKERVSASHRDRRYKLGDAMAEWWEPAQPAIEDGPIDDYLGSRGLKLYDRSVVRYSPAFDFDANSRVLPEDRHLIKPAAMVALTYDAETDVVLGVHVTYLDKHNRNFEYHGSKKITLASNIGVIKLRVVEGSRILIIAEGIETALSAMLDPAFDGASIWSTSTALGMRNLMPLPDFDEIIIIVDIDAPQDGETEGEGEKAAEVCASNWRNAGKKARLLKPTLPQGEHKVDLNDTIRAKDWVPGKGYTVEDFEPPVRPLKELLADRKAPLSDIIAALNKEYSFALEGGRATVLRQEEDRALKRTLYTRLRTVDFKAAFQNRLVRDGEYKNGEPRYKKLGEAWLDSTERRQYLKGVVFDPTGGVSVDALNLWCGFSIEPRRGSWCKMRQHIWKIVCKKDRASFRYLLQWMALMVQHPELQGYIIAVLKGAKGVGKGILAQALLRMLRSHALHITNAKHLTGNFNRHLQSCVFLFADEALYAGDKAHEGVLKGLATEPTLPIEAKFFDVVEARNFLHILMATNEKWAIPATLDERRFFVLEVSDEHANDHKYFDPIIKEMKQDGGDAAMLDFLLRLDLSKFNVADVPHTEGLQEQKRQSLPLEYLWFEDVLARGYVWDSKLGAEKVMRDWFKFVTTDMLFNSYESFVDKQRRPYAKRLGRVDFGKFLHNDLGLRPSKSRQALDYEERGDEMNGFQGRAKLNDKARPAYELGELADARAHYAEITKLKPPKVAGEDALETEFMHPLDDGANVASKDTEGNVVRGDFGTRKSPAA